MGSRRMEIAGIEEEAPTAEEEEYDIGVVCGRYLADSSFVEEAVDDAVFRDKTAAAPKLGHHAGTAAMATAPFRSLMGRTKERGRASPAWGRKKRGMVGRVWRGGWLYGGAGVQRRRGVHAIDVGECGTFTSPACSGKEDDKTDKGKGWAGALLGPARE